MTTNHSKPLAAEGGSSSSESQRSIPVDFAAACDEALRLALLEPYGLDTQDVTVVSADIFEYVLQLQTQYSATAEAVWQHMPGPVSLETGDRQADSREEGERLFTAQAQEEDEACTQTARAWVYSDTSIADQQHEVTGEGQGRIVCLEPCGACAGTGRTDCAICTTKGRIACYTCSGAKEHRCEACDGTGTRSILWQCRYTLNAHTTVQHFSLAPDCVYTLVQQKIHNNEVCWFEQHCTMHEKNCQCDTMESMQIKRTFQIPLRVYILRVQGTDVVCVYMGREPFLVNEEECQHMLMRITMHRVREKLDHERWGLPVWPRVLGHLAAALRTPRIQEQIRQDSVPDAPGVPDVKEAQLWQEPTLAIMARFRRTLCLACLVPAVLACTLSAKTVHAASVASLQYTGRALQSLWQGLIWLWGLEMWSALATGVSWTVFTASAWIGAGCSLLWDWGWRALALVDAAAAQQGLAWSEAHMHTLGETLHQARNLGAQIWEAGGLLTTFLLTEGGQALALRADKAMEALLTRPLGGLFLVWAVVLPLVIFAVMQIFFVLVSYGMGGRYFLPWLHKRLNPACRLPVPLMFLAGMLIFTRACLRWWGIA